MKYTAALFVIILLFFSCREEGTPSNKNRDVIDSYFPATNSDTLHVSHWIWWSEDSVNYGKIIPDSLFFNLIDTNKFLNAEYRDKFPLKWDEFYALKKIPINQDIDGLIVRTQSITFLSQRVDMYLFNNKTQNIISSHKLAELEANEGEIDQVDSWLYDINKDKYPDIVSRTYSSYQLGSDSLVVNDSIAAFIWNNSKRDFENYKLAGAQLLKTKLRFYPASPQ